MRLSFSLRDVRALRLGAIAIAPVMAIQLVLKPYASAMTTARSEYVAERELLARELRVLDDSAAYEAVQRDVQQVRSTAEDRLFSVSDEIEAASAFTRLVRDHAGAAYLLVRQIEAKPAESIGGELWAIDVTLRGESDLEGILTFLRALEVDERLLTIPALRIEQVASDETSPGEPSVLTVVLTLRGYALVSRQSMSARSGGQ